MGGGGNPSIRNKQGVATPCCHMGSNLIKAARQQGTSCQVREIAGQQSRLQRGFVEQWNIRKQYRASITVQDYHSTGKNS